MNNTKDGAKPFPWPDFLISIVLIGGLAAIMVQANSVRNHQLSMKTVCEKNLKQIKEAKQKYYDGHLERYKDVTPPETGIVAIIGRKLECPAHGKYSLNRAGENPTCSYYWQGGKEDVIFHYLH